MINAEEFYDTITKYMRSYYTQGYSSEQVRFKQTAMTQLKILLEEHYPDIQDLSFDDDFGADYSTFCIKIDNIPILLISTDSYNIQRGYYKNITWSKNIQSLDADISSVPLEELVAQAKQKQNEQIITNSKSKIRNYLNCIKNELTTIMDVGVNIDNLSDILISFEEKL